MQAIHNYLLCCESSSQLFQRAKIQDKCKQFTTRGWSRSCRPRCFKEQRYKINASNSQLVTPSTLFPYRCFKEQRYKINASNSQQAWRWSSRRHSCFKEQRYKINASNSQRSSSVLLSSCGCFKEQRYKINASNSQLCTCCCCFICWLFQRAKIQDKCKQFTTGSSC